MRRVLLLVLVAVLLQAAAVALFVWVSGAAYGHPRRLDEALALPLTWAGLVLAGPLALSCATAATFRSLRRLRFRLAVPVLLLCLPSMLTGVFVTFTLACVRGWC